MKILHILLLIIFSATLYSQDCEPTEQIVLVEVVVKDNENNFLNGEKVIFKSRNNKKEYVVYTDVNGYSKLCLPKGDIYDVSYLDLFDDVGYAMLEVPLTEGIYTYSVDIIYEPSRVFTLENVYFEFAKSSLIPSSYSALDELVALLKSEKSMKIEIMGHTDNVGSKDSNLKLSKDRAESVKNYLVQKGISPSRVSAVGYGDTQPVASNDSEEGRAKNRRTEVKIISK